MKVEAAAQHVAIIMDGNGRWAKQRGLPRTIGHHRGIGRVREIVKAADECGVKVLTLFAFSTENWKRPPREITMLMRALRHFLKKEIASFNRHNIRFRRIGRDEGLSVDVLALLKEAEQATKHNTGLTVNVALNYGGRAEIIDAAKKIAQAAAKKEFDIKALDEDTFSRFLYTAGMPDPDLLIRTSGEMRISNFLLWQLSYAELYFTKKYWPDFTAEEFKKALKDFEQRQRRFGTA